MDDAPVQVGQPLGALAAPALFLESDSVGKPPADRIGICLSGGGYRAMLFHLGAVWRLCEVGILGRAQRISSVSGGSITAALLGLNWSRLGLRDRTPGPVPPEFHRLIAEPLRALASRTIDVRPSVRGFLCLGGAADAVARIYERRLFRGATLQDLPTDSEGPRFIINASNLLTGVLWRFSRPYMADYTVGRVLEPTVALSTAVAASAAFPPLLSPLRLDLRGVTWAPDPIDKPTPRNAHRRNEAVLTDGGVYDNLGLETVYKNTRTVLVSDAGGGAEYWDPRAQRNWFRQLCRVFWVQRQQVGALRRRQLLSASRPLANPGPREDPWWRHAALWSIGTRLARYGLPETPILPPERAEELARTPVRLAAMPDDLQDRLINWGYASCNASLRRWYDPTLGPSATLPYR